MMRRVLLLLALAAGASLDARAQGALAVQGFGYPTGQLSAASLGLGGANAEIDPASPINPANLGRPTRYSIYLQYEPEFRRTTIGGSSSNTTTIRFPGFLMSGAIGRFTLGASFSTLLDRTWSNVYTDTIVIDGTPQSSTLIAGSDGAMNDARFASSFWINPRLQVGLGVHAISGENRVQFGRFFADSSGLGNVSQSSVINFSGRAFSLGVIGAPTSNLLLGASARIGGDVTAEQADEPLSEAKVPSRIGVTAAWFGIPNTTIAARVERTEWTALDGLSTAATTLFDATELGLGVDVVGPRIGQAFSTARIGFRDRTLPYGVNGEQVSERSLSGGVAIPLARGRGNIDLALQRATRKAAGATEKAWFLSIGLGIRP
ncbi:MAG: hypothetical protein KJZ74_03020 [Gemmatimonadales bacterium]|nr:hypothetical protein [Gemmatimonadales bacterium]